MDFNLHLLDALRSHLLAEGINCDFRVTTHNRNSRGCVVSKVSLDDPPDVWWRQKNLYPFLRIDKLYCNARYVTEAQSPYLIVDQDIGSICISSMKFLLSDPQCLDKLVAFLKHSLNIREAAFEATCNTPK